MKGHCVRPNCSQTGLAVLAEPSCIHNAQVTDVGFVTLSAQNTTVENQGFVRYLLAIAGKSAKIIQFYSKRDAPKQQQTIGWFFFCVRKQVIILKTKLSAKVQNPCSEKYASIFRLGTSALA